jgi:prophage regulatory protein
MARHSSIPDSNEQGSAASGRQLTLRFIRYDAIFPHQSFGALLSFTTYRFNLEILRSNWKSSMAIASSNAALPRTIRRQQLREMIPLADSTIYEMEQRGEFPLRFALSPRCIVWDLAEVEAWLLARRACPIRRAQHPDVSKRKTRPVKAPDQAPPEA